MLNDEPNESDSICLISNQPLEDNSIKFYVLPLSIIGFCISFYHYLVQKVPGFSEVRPCEQGVSCNAQYIDWMGFITIPFLALTAFFLITVILGRISTKQ